MNLKQIYSHKGKEAAILLALLFTAGHVSAQRVYPTGVTVYDAQRAYNSYIIFSAPDNKTHLVDMNGKQVRTWDYIGFPSELLDPAVTGGKKGNVLVQYESLSGEGTSATPGKNSIFQNKSIAELDWDGKLLWKWGDKAPGGAARQHHDWQRLANGNTLVLANQLQAIPGFKLPKLLDDVIYEVSERKDMKIYISAVIFYEKLILLNEEELEAGNFSKEEAKESLRHIKHYAP